jgi:hypothetical protein
MALQTTYTDRIRPAVAGMQGTMQQATMVSRTVMNAAGVDFGKAVSRHAGEDNGCHAFTTGDTAIFGVTIRERSLVSEGTKFVQYDAARIMREGDVWVVAAQDVTPGLPVYVRPSNGDFQKDNTNSAVLMPGAQWETTATATNLALISIKPIQ